MHHFIRKLIVALIIILVAFVALFLVAPRQTPKIGTESPFPKIPDGFRGPTSPPNMKGPTGPPPNR